MFPCEMDKSFAAVIVEPRRHVVSRGFWLPCRISYPAMCTGDLFSRFEGGMCSGLGSAGVDVGRQPAEQRSAPEDGAGGGRLGAGWARGRGGASWAKGQANLRGSHVRFGHKTQKFRCKIRLGA